MWIKIHILFQSKQLNLPYMTIAEIAAFKEAASQLHGKLQFGYTAADVTKQV